MLASLGRPDDALAAYQVACERYDLALRIKPDKHEARFNLSLALEQQGWLLAAAGAWPEAIQALERADAERSALAPERPLLGWHYYRRWFIRRHRADAEAIQCLQRVLSMGREELARDNAVGGYCNLGLFLLANGQEDNALALYRQALEEGASQSDIAQACIELGALGALLGPEVVAKARLLLDESAPSPH